MKKKADEHFSSSIKDCKTQDDVKKALDNKKIARFSYCDMEGPGAKCAEFVEKELQARVMGTRADKKEKADGKCVFCGKPAKEVAYAAKSY